jgi:two-component system CheB/CheR fusion protein
MIRIPVRQMKLRLSDMPVGLAVSLTAAVVVACAAGGWLYSRHHFQTLLESERRSALAEGELIRVALEHQMIENDRTLIARMVANFGKQTRVDRLMILDRSGVVRHSSGPLPPSDDLRIDSETCQACHRHPPDQRGSSRIIETAGRAFLRTVIPIRNREECHRCHDPAHGINGILILDYNTDAIHASINGDLWWMVIGTSTLTLLLIGAIGLVIRFFLLKRLQKIEIAARQIANGALDRRVPADGFDTLGWLAREFNTMADSVTGLVAEVRSERERLETVINGIDDGIVVLDAERNVMAANDAFLRRAEHSREQVLGCCCRDVGPGSCDAGNCPTIACLKSGQRQVRICERRAPEGTAWEEVHASPIRDVDGKLQYVVEVWRDISDRRAAEAHLAESHRLASVGMLASGFSHELSTPLGTVLMCVEGILHDFASDGGARIDKDRIQENASIAREQILRCRGITQQFLRMSRGQKGGGGIVDALSVVDAVERLVGPTARTQGVSVVIEPGPSSAMVSADEGDLQNVLVNLLLNAIQACDRGGRVSVSVHPGPETRIRVRDNGCGIQPEDHDRLFEPFFSLRNGGNGLGLFFSLNAARQWGGTIRMESALGQGSTFEIAVPACETSMRAGTAV